MEINQKKEAQSSALLFALVFVVYALVYMTKNCYNAAMASIVKEGIMTKSQTGLIGAIFSIVYAPFQILGGFAADKYSEKKLIAIGIIGAGIANLLIYFVQNYIAMIIIWSLNAVVQFGIWPGFFKILTTRIIPRHRVKAVFYIGMASYLGLVFSYLTSIFITNWKNNFLLSAIILFVSALVFVVCYNMFDDKLKVEQVVKEEKQSKSGNMWSLSLQSGLLFLSVIYLVVNTLNIGLSSIIPVMLMESYKGISPAIANGLNIILIMTGPFGIIISNNKIFSKYDSVSVIAFFVALCLPFLFAITFLGKVSIAVIIAAFTVMMLFLSVTVPFFSEISLDFNKYGRSATVAGILNCMAAFGGFISHYVFTKLAETLGWIPTVWSWVALAAFTLILTVITIPVWRKFIKK